MAGEGLFALLIGFSTFKGISNGVDHRAEGGVQMFQPFGGAVDFQGGTPGIGQEKQAGILKLLLEFFQTGQVGIQFGGRLELGTDLVAIKTGQGHDLGATFDRLDQQQGRRRKATKGAGLG